MIRPRQARGWRWLPALTFGALAVALVAAGLQLDRSLRAGARHRAAAELDAVATLKVRTLEQWRAGHLAELRYVAAWPTIDQLAAEAERGSVEPRLVAHTREVLAGFGAGRGYLRLAVLGGDGRPLVDWLAPGAADHPLDEEVVAEASRSRQTGWSLHDHDDRHRPWFDAALPIGGPGTSLVLAARADPDEVLEEIITTWPVPTETAVTALVRREGEVARVLVAPREASGGSPTLAIPLAERSRPAVQAALGAVGVVEGVSFLKQKPILAAIRPVEGTGWKLFTRMNLSEVEAPVLRPAQVIFGLVAALLAAAGALTLVWWRADRSRTRAEDELAEAAERLRLALGDSLFVWDWDLTAGRLDADARWSEKLGVPASALTGTTDEILRRTTHPDDLEFVRRQLDAHLRGAAPSYDVESRTVLPGGGVRWFRTRGQVTRRDAGGAPLHLVGVISDVTEQRADQARLELGERMASLGTLAAGVAHELNNPLAAVVGSLDLLAVERSAELPPELREAAVDARDAAARMREVLGGLRAFSRGGAERPAAVSVRAELEAALRLAGNELRHRARLEVEVGPLPAVAARQHQLGQVFLNLLVNAAQAIPEGHAGEHLVRARAFTGPDGAAVVEISDTGSGIPRELLPRLFEPFFTTRAEGVGTGLGLAIAHAIVTAAGGRIEVESEVGHGSTFRVVLPVAPDQPAADPGGAAVVAAPPVTPPAPAPAPVIPAPVIPAPARPQVLVIDDDPMVARAIIRLLRRDHDVEAVHSGAAGLALLLGERRFDAVFCDLMMPEMTGMELYARLSAARPEVAARLIFVTGGAFTPDAADFLEKATNPCLEKPFEPTALRAAVEQVAGGRSRSL
jgi:signal transduction histidine kinase/ActR/RegA family two-component response regulator